jgi:hypothetical protein
MRNRGVFHVVAALLVGWLAATSVARAQTKASDHTLKLQKKENMPHVRIEGIAWLAGR